MSFPNRSDTNRPVQAQKQARSLKFRIYEEEEVCYPCSENKGADQLRGYRVFVFAYADCWFSHEAAHIIECPYLYKWCMTDKSVEPRHEKTNNVVSGQVQH